MACASGGGGLGQGAVTAQLALTRHCGQGWQRRRDPDSGSRGLWSWWGEGAITALDCTANETLCPNTNSSKNPTLGGGTRERATMK